MRTDNSGMASRWVDSISGRTVQVAWAFALAAASACVLLSCGSGSEGVPETCAKSSDCPDQLVCGFSTCREECLMTTDCSEREHCVKTEDRYFVCQHESESKCARDDDCDPPLLCSAQGECRNRCDRDAECVPGQLCVDDVCIEIAAGDGHPDEVPPLGAEPIEVTIDEGGGSSQIAAGLAFEFPADSVTQGPLVLRIWALSEEQVRSAITTDGVSPQLLLGFNAEVIEGELSGPFFAVASRLPQQHLAGPIFHYLINAHGLRVIQPTELELRPAEPFLRTRIEHLSTHVVLRWAAAEAPADKQQDPGGQAEDECKLYPCRCGHIFVVSEASEQTTDDCTKVTEMVRVTFDDCPGGPTEVHLGGTASEACTEDDSCPCLMHDIPCMTPFECDPDKTDCSQELHSYAEPEGTECDDEDACTLDDACRAGRCVGQAKACDPAEECQPENVCDPQTGSCEPGPDIPEGTPCNDDEICTFDDRCHGGKCAGTNRVDGDRCQQGDPCVIAECLGGHCASTYRPVCNDRLDCTEDKCHDGECSYEPNDALCPDGATCEPEAGGCIVPIDCSRATDLSWSPLVELGRVIRGSGVAAAASAAGAWISYAKDDGSYPVETWTSTIGHYAWESGWQDVQSIEEGAYAPGTLAANDTGEVFVTGMQGVWRYANSAWASVAGGAPYFAYVDVDARGSAVEVITLGYASFSLYEPGGSFRGIVPPRAAEAPEGMTVRDVRINQRGDILVVSVFANNRDIESCVQAALYNSETGWNPDMLFVAAPDLADTAGGVVAYGALDDEGNALVGYHEWQDDSVAWTSVHVYERGRGWQEPKVFESNIYQRRGSRFIAGRGKALVAVGTTRVPEGGDPPSGFLFRYEVGTGWLEPATVDLFSAAAVDVDACGNGVVVGGSASGDAVSRYCVPGATGPDDVDHCYTFPINQGLAVSRYVGGQLLPPVEFGSTGVYTNASVPDVAVARDGRAIVSWTFLPEDARQDPSYPSGYVRVLE